MSAPARPLFVFDNSYRRLPERFYELVDPAEVPDPKLIKLNRDLADDLGLDPDVLDGDLGARIFSGQDRARGSEPLAMAYAGHQFGSFVPQLGDGRALLLGEVVDRTGARRDIQLKGAGLTPFSRGGDGRAALGPVLREYIVSEAMHALGIPTTRALAAVTTGAPVYREARLPGAVLTRVASSHIRVGTFQYFAVRGDTEAVRLLCDHVIGRHYPHLKGSDQPALGLLDAVVRAQANLIAHWMSVGFIHGVMNTDNTTVSGETIDYGPCAFMDTYDPETVFSSIDHFGRYAYGAQPNIAQWNLARLAETLLPLVNENTDAAIEAVTPVIVGYADHFNRRWTALFRRKIGLMAAEEGDTDLIRDFLDVMHRGGADFTLAFRHLSDAIAPAGQAALAAHFHHPDGLEAWLSRWRDRLAQEDVSLEDRKAAMAAANPLFIPRNHRVEQAIRAAVQDNDFTPFERLVAVLSRPFQDQPDAMDYAAPPRSEETVKQTFCGT